MKYMIGCNYWDSRSGTEMWRNWNENSVADDLKCLASYGVRYMRVFPNWRDFQPLHALRKYHGQFGEYKLHGKFPMTDEFGLDETCMARFEEFIRISQKCNIHLIVSLITGWMSGMLFVPPAVEGKNHISDPESLKLQLKFVRGFVRHFKDSEQIVAWDLGNECNCMSCICSPDEGYLWTATIRNAILSEDSSRQIMSGMHSLTVFPERGKWTISDQAELTDVLCPHPYPSPTVGGDVAPINSLRTSLIPTFMCEYYSGIGEKPSIIQETGTFSSMVGNEDCTADFFRVCLFSGWANGSLGYLWWCAFDYPHLNFPPYSWNMNERELGILHADRTPKLVAYEMKRACELLESLPFNELPKKDVDAVCVVTRNNENNYQGIALASYILAKQAGIETKLISCNNNIPDSKLYFIPSIEGWSCMDKDKYEKILANVHAGASLYVSVNSGFLTDFENVFGIQSVGMRNNSKTKEVLFADKKLIVKYGKEFLLRATSAEVIISDDEGNIILSKNRYGKGWAYFLNFPMEKMLYEKDNIFNRAEEYPYYKLYAEVASFALQNKIVVSDNPEIGVTQHKESDKCYYIVAINYSSVVQKTKFIKSSIIKKIEVIFGDENSIPGCSMAILKVYLK